MDIRAYWDILWRRKWVILVTFLAALAATISGTHETTPIYQASAVIRVRVASGGTTSSADYYYADRLINTYAQIATSKPVLDEVSEKLNLKMAPEITALPVANSELIQITVDHPNPGRAAEVANTLADILVARSNELYTGGGKTASQILSDQLAHVETELEEAQEEYERLVAVEPEDTRPIDELSRSIGVKQGLYSMLLQQYETARTSEAVRSNALSIIDPASIPTRPIKPNMVLNIGLGFMVGLVGGIGLAFVLDLLDTRLHTVEQIEDATDLPTLGRIPHTRKRPQSVFDKGGSLEREAYRQLRTSLYAIARQGTLRTVLVTSAMPYEGKSTVVTNLAVALAQAGHGVLAVDGDLRKPKLHINFSLPNRIGLTSVLKGELGLCEAVQNTTSCGLSVLTSGPLSTNPAEMLCSLQMQSLLEEMLHSFDMVLVDAPALLPVTDAAILAPMVDGVVLVVRRAQSEKQAVQTARRELTEMGARLLGLVVTRTNKHRSQERYHRYYRLPDAVLPTDPLTRIEGISRVYEKALNARGIVSYAQLAEQNPDALAEALGVPITAERIRRDRWVEQARALVDGNREGPGKGNGRWHRESQTRFRPPSGDDHGRDDS